MIKFFFFPIFNYNYERSLVIVDVLTMFDDAISTIAILEMQCSKTPWWQMWKSFSQSFDG